MFSFFTRKQPELPPATTPQEEEWNAKEHNKELAKTLRPSAVKAVRDADMMSKQRYDEMDEDISQMKNVRARLDSSED